jgi:PadR family transcriptional regulator, regulatory protein AphA
MLKYALLGFLNYQPMNGYELKQRMDRSTSHFWHARLSQIYVTLKAMEEAGLVVSRVEEQETRPDKRLYTITPEGRTDLRVWLIQPELELSPKKETLVLKLFFSGQLERETILTQLRLQRELHERQLAFYRKVVPADIRQAAGEFPGMRKDALLWEATRRFGEEYEALYVRWLEETLTLVENSF